MAKHNYFFCKTTFHYDVGKDPITFLTGVIGVEERLRCVTVVIPGSSITHFPWGWVCVCLAAASVSSITESLPVQCTEGSAQETQSTLDSTSTPSMQPR